MEWCISQTWIPTTSLAKSRTVVVIPITVGLSPFARRSSILSDEAARPFNGLATSNFSDEMAATRDYAQDLSDNARDFDNLKAKWICWNRKYPANPLAELQAYQDTLYEILATHGSWLRMVPEIFLVPAKPIKVMKGRKFIDEDEADAVDD